jgi:hypothetical protein
LKYRIHTNQTSAQTSTTSSQYSAIYIDHLKSQNKRIYQLWHLYDKLLVKNEKNTYRFLINFKFLRIYIKSLILSPKFTSGLTFYFIINLTISRICSKLTR